MKQLVSYEQAVLRLVPCSHLTQNQFDSLVSFAYNLGSGSLRASTLRKKVIKGDPTAPDEFPVGPMPVVNLFVAYTVDAWQKEIYFCQVKHLQSTPETVINKNNLKRRT